VDHSDDMCDTVSVIATKSAKHWGDLDPNVMTGLYGLQMQCCEYVAVILVLCRYPDRMKASPTT
jgi:hypothetical protein